MPYLNRDYRQQIVKSRTDLYILPNVVNKFKTITEEQLYQFMPNKYKTQNLDPMNHYKALIRRLDQKRSIRIDNGCIYPALGDDRHDQKMIDALWVLIELTKDIPDFELSKFYAEVMANKTRTCTLSFILNREKVIKVIVVHTPSDLALLNDENMALQSSEISDLYAYYIVIRSESFLPDIEKLNIKFPHNIALLKGEPLEKPEIIFFG